MDNDVFMNFLVFIFKNDIIRFNFIIMDLMEIDSFIGIFLFKDIEIIKLVSFFVKYIL